MKQSTKVRKVKAWACIKKNKTGTLGELGGSKHLIPKIYYNKKKAMDPGLIFNPDETIVPCIIIYSLPTANKKGT